MINAKTAIKKIKKYCDDNGVKGIVLGISGGKDSTVTAKLFAEAIGPENVIGVLMPNNTQSDISDSKEIVKLLGIQSMEVNIGKAFAGLLSSIDSQLMEKRINDVTIVSDQAISNIPPRLRMTVLYAICQSLGHGYRVCGTTNKSEYYIGWFTKWGDGAADIEPIINLTCSEVVQLGLELGLPEKFIKKPPADGLGNLKTDEQKLGFTYEELDKFLEDKVSQELTENQLKMMKMYDNSRHKRQDIPTIL